MNPKSEPVAAGEPTKSADAALERFGIYGGTFSPIHTGHLKAARAFYDSLSLDRLLLIPTAEPPHKETVSGASSRERLDMVRLAVDELKSEYADRIPDIEASDYEVRREGKSYTVYTLEHFKKPWRELYLLVGTDMFLTLDRWYRAEDIFKLTKIALMRRESDPKNGERIEEKKREYEEKFGAKIRELNEPHIELSSTELREKLENGEKIANYVPGSVEAYIKEHGLYKCR